jgi:hypothetical protein
MSTTISNFCFALINNYKLLVDLLNHNVRQQLNFHSHSLRLSGINCQTLLAPDENYLQSTFTTAKYLKSSGTPFFLKLVR